MFSWLEYSPKKNAVYCFPCRMFCGSIELNAGQFEIVFSKIGFTNWKVATEKFNVHQRLKCHLNSTTLLKTFLNPNSKLIDVILDQQREDIRSQKEINRLKNKETMKKLIDIVLFLGVGGKSFRRHTEKTNDVHKGLFLDIVRLLRMYDPVFDQHFISGPQNALYTSNRIQNDIIQSVNLVMKRQLQSTIANKKVSIIADETSNCGHHEQLSIGVRYFDTQKRCPYEQFICMKQITSVNAENIFKVLSDTIHKYNIKWENLVSHTHTHTHTLTPSERRIEL
jgi:hypothetical protein